MTLSLADVERAAGVIEGAVVATELSVSRTLSHLLGAEVWLKFENQQFTGSFKDRGALNRLSALDEAARGRGVVAMSAGNHAQGVAYHAGRLGIPATIVMPLGTPFVKISGTEVLGARVSLAGETVDEAAGIAREVAERDGLTFVHPYDDPLVVAGQGTIALELLAQGPPLDALLVPIGGGGLIAGIATVIAARAPRTKVYGVQAALYPSMRNALSGEARPLGGATVADGMAVKTPGALARPIIARLVEDLILVGEDAIEQAIVVLAEIEKTLVEGAGAAPLAALMTERGRFAGQRVGLILSGGNIDPRLLASVIMRSLVRSGRIARLRLTLADRPGMLGQVAQIVGAAYANILEVYHERAFLQVPAKSAGLVLVLETRDDGHVGLVIDRLKAAGFSVERLLPDHLEQHATA
jgi:threonine dehydratase